MTEEEAAKVVFPSEKTIRKEIALDSTTQGSVEGILKRRVEDRYVLFVAVKDGEATGYAVIVDEVTKTLTMTFIVGVGLDGKVLDVAVIEHKEKIGADCAKRKFLDQLKGKTLNDPIKRKKDVIHVVGATMSCDAVLRGTRKALAVVKEYCTADRVRAIVQEEPVTLQRHLMGSLVTITAHGSKASVNRAFDEIKRLDSILSNYQETSELSRLNREGSIEPGPELRNFLEQSRRYHELSGGAFDPTVAPLVRLWGFHDGKYRVPSRTELENAVIGFDKISLDRGVKLNGAQLDPGAIGKGIAVDAAVEILKKEGVTRAFVDFDSTVYALGTWKVAIRNPFQKDKTLGTLEVSNASVSTSGNYEKYFETDGKRYTHILDPRTRMPVEGVASVSVIAPSGAASDALSTAIFVGGLDLAAKAKVEAMLVTSDPKADAKTTPGWKFVKE